MIFYCKFKLYGNSLDSNELLKYGIKVSITNYCEVLNFVDANVRDF